jgi:hypothetical protein
MEKFTVDSEGKRWIEMEDGSKYACTGYVGEVRSGYMCATDFADEVGRAPQTGPICSTLEALKKAKGCLDECGWVRVLCIAAEISPGKNRQSHPIRKTSD